MTRVTLTLAMIALLLLLIRFVRRGAPSWAIWGAAFLVGALLTFPIGCTTSSGNVTRTRCESAYGLKLFGSGDGANVLWALLVAAGLSFLVLLIVRRQRPGS
jgi:hypothetical protein